MIDVQPTLDRIDALLAECDAEQQPAGATRARCMAHGNERCTWCSLNPASCADAYGQCTAYARDGMHWDTCPNRISGPEDGRNRLGLHAFPALGSRPLAASPPPASRRRLRWPWSRR